jgi:hypothetical protein
MENEVNKEELIKQIQELIGFEMNLSSFTDEDLLQTRDDLIKQKENIQQDTKQWFDDELVEKLS